MALLFIDMLGVRARWHIGGRESAERAFSEFRSVIAEAIRTRPSGKVSHGLIEADSAAIVCSSLKEAVRIGRSAFHLAFLGAKNPRDERLWLRGVIIPTDETEQLRTDHTLAPDLEHIKVSSYSTTLLEAISAEKAGFKGMRLLIGGNLNRKQVRRAWDLGINKRRITPMIRLLTPPYPGRLSEGYRDVLWMASGKKDKRDDLKQRMFERLRWAASNADELVHAAVTQVIFNHCEAYIAHAVSEESNEEVELGMPNNSFNPTPR